VRAFYLQVDVGADSGAVPAHAGSGAAYLEAARLEGTDLLKHHWRAVEAVRGETNAIRDQKNKSTGRTKLLKFQEYFALIERSA
jgi:hypothetical protein